MYSLALSPVCTLVEARKRRSLSQRELAALAGISPHTLSDVERGLRRPMPRVRRQLANALNVDPQQIIWESRP